MWRSVALTLLLQSQPTWLEIGDAQSRCSLQGCLVEATTTKPIPQTIENIVKEQTSVFYEEDRFFLHYDLRKRIRDFLQEHPSQTRFVITGWTDGCGEHDYNKELSRKRADEVARYVLSLRKGALVQLEWKGEATGKHTINGRRVDLAVFKKAKHPIVPIKIIADFYLIDGSGSMGGKWRPWTNAIAYWRPKHSKVYVANTGYIPHKSNLQNIRPGGGTEIHYALWALLDKIPPGKTLLVISDFRSSVPLTPRERERIDQKAAERGVKISYIKL